MSFLGLFKKTPQQLRDMEERELSALDSIIAPFDENWSRLAANRLYTKIEDAINAYKERINKGPPRSGADEDEYERVKENLDATIASIKGPIKSIKKDLEGIDKALNDFKNAAEDIENKLVFHYLRKGKKDYVLFDLWEGIGINARVIKLPIPAKSQAALAVHNRALEVTNIHAPKLVFSKQHFANTPQLSEQTTLNLNELYFLYWFNEKKAQYVLLGECMITWPGAPFVPVAESARDYEPPKRSTIS